MEEIFGESTRKAIDSNEKSEIFRNANFDESYEKVENIPFHPKGKSNR